MGRETLVLQAVGAHLCRHHAKPSLLVVPLRQLLRKAPGPQQESQQLCLILCSTGNLGSSKALGFWGFWLLIDLLLSFTPVTNLHGSSLLLLYYFFAICQGFFYFPALSDSPVPSLGCPHSPAAHVLPTSRALTAALDRGLSPTRWLCGISRIPELK